MKDVIEMLLQKQATLDEDCEYAKMVECEKIDAQFAERKTKIKSLLDMAGYEPPVVAEAAVTEETDLSAVAVEIPAQPVQPVPTQKVY